MRIEHAITLDGNSRVIGRHQEQRDSVRIMIGTSGAGAHDQRIGVVAIDYGCFPACQVKAGAAGFGLGGDRIRRMPAGFVHGQGQQVASSCNFRQVLPTLFSATALDYGGDTHKAGAQQRARCQRAPGLLEHDSQSGVAVFQSTVLFRNQDGGPAHLRHFRPQLW